MPNVKIRASSGHEFELKRSLVAHINSKACVNCGECREACPVEAIHENQRTICRLCPECTDRPALTLDEMDEFATARACTTACPLGISPQGYINLTKAGKPEKAYKLIWEKNPLPEVCARICHHPCEQSCKRGLLVDEPIAIRDVKRYLGDTQTWKPEPYPRIYEEEVAVIGAGPAGLTAAHYLASAGYEVTVFDSAPEAGGMLVRGIPEFRLSREVVRKEIAAIEEAGVHFHLGEKVNQRRYNELKSEFDAVIVATGAPNGKSLKIEGDHLDGIMTALDFMEHVNNGQDLHRHPGQYFDLVGKKAVVIGGGSVAMDCARTAIRLGASHVTTVCLESGENVPAHPWELKEAAEEGVEIMEGYSPRRYLGKHPRLTGIELAKVKNFRKDENGKIAFEIDDTETTVIDADWVVVAIGQAADALWRNLDDGAILAGDVNGGACSVVDAMASGKKAAAKIDATLRGRSLRDPDSLRVLHDAPLIEKIYPATRLKTARVERPILPPEERVKSFAETTLCLTDEEAANEVNRCLGCGYSEVSADMCIGCGVCARICPKGDVITLVAAEKGGDE